MYNSILQLCVFSSDFVELKQAREAMQATDSGP